MGAGAERMAIAQGSYHGRSGGRNNFQYSQEEIDAYNRGWSSFMVQILQEQIERLKVSDSGRLMQSVHELIQTGTVTTIEHRFLMYGIYVAAGVGKGFEHGNGGDLLFMGDPYRAAHGRYGSRQVGAGLSEHAMLSPKYEHITVHHGKNAGKEAALTSGGKRQPRDWFFKKYYYSLHKLNETNARFFGSAYQGLTSTFLEGLFAGISDKNRIRSNHF
jgi:hypothetical protein